MDLRGVGAGGAGAQCTKIDFRGSFRGARVKIENQDKTNIDFFPYSGTTGFRSNF